MILLVIVETGNMTQVLVSRAGNVGDIDLGGWGRTRVVLSLLVFQATLLLLFLPSFSVRGFSALGTVRRGHFLSPGLRFFNPGVFHRAALALSGGGIDWPGILRIMLVCFTRSKARIECRLSFGVNYFLYCILKAVQFAAVLLYFGSDRRS